MPKYLVPQISPGQRLSYMNQRGSPDLYDLFPVYEIVDTDDPAPIQALTPAPVPAPIDTLLNEEQAAERAGVSRKQIRKLIKSGRLDAVDYGTGKRKHYRIKPEALAALQDRPADPVPAPRQRRRPAISASRRSIFPRV